MEIIKKRIKELETEKDNILNSYPEEDGEMQTMLAMGNMRLSMEIKFLKELRDILIAQNKIERILCSANWYDDGVKHVHQPTNIKIGYVIAGQRHHNCIYTFSLIQKDVKKEETIKLQRTEVQGFLTSKNRFVGRKLATKIAFEANQLPENGHKIKINQELFSEDLY